MPECWNGRQYGLKNHCGKPRVCSSHTSGTNILWDGVMVTHWAHNPKTVDACSGSTPDPATNIQVFNKYYS